MLLADGTRLLTLSGPGGSGKTRLGAIALAISLVVWLIIAWVLGDW